MAMYKIYEKKMQNILSINERRKVQKGFIILSETCWRVNYLLIFFYCQLAVGERSISNEAKSWGLVEFLLVRMPAWVTIEGENPSCRKTKVSRVKVVYPGLVGT